MNWRTVRFISQQKNPGQNKEPQTGTLLQKSKFNFTEIEIIKKGNIYHEKKLCCINYVKKSFKIDVFAGHTSCETPYCDRSAHLKNFYFRGLNVIFEFLFNVFNLNVTLKQLFLELPKNVCAFG